MLGDLNLDRRQVEHLRRSADTTWASPSPHPQPQQVSGRWVTRRSGVASATRLRWWPSAPGCFPGSPQAFPSSSPSAAPGPSPAVAPGSASSRPAQCSGPTNSTTSSPTRPQDQRSGPATYPGSAPPSAGTPRGSGHRVIALTHEGIDDHLAGGQGTRITCASSSSPTPCCPPGTSTSLPTNLGKPAASTPSNRTTTANRSGPLRWRHGTVA